jgi:REP element-mobilizing transposase RayT
MIARSSLSVPATRTIEPYDGGANSYFISTVGGAPLAVVKQYIENQKHV